MTATENTPAGGNFSVAIRLTNDGQRTCRTFGYPGVSVLDAAGKQQYQARRTLSGYSGGLHAGESPQHITLAPGTSATAVLEGGNKSASGQACPTDHAVLITPPNTQDSVRRSVTVYICTAPLIHPLVPGSTGIG